MGIHINGDHNAVNVVHGDVYYSEDRGGGYGPQQQPPIGLFSLFFLALIVLLVIKFWWIVLIAVSVSAIAYAAWLGHKENRQVALEAELREQALAARAERQNSAYLRGEPWGMYGHYPPETGL